MIIPEVNFGEKNVYHSVSFVTQARDHNANRELDEDRQTGRRKINYKDEAMYSPLNHRWPEHL